jgi:hypothetical protein
VTPRARTNITITSFGGEIMQINKRPLGSSGLEITTVGFGAWAIGGGGWSVREITSPRW